MRRELLVGDELAQPGRAVPEVEGVQPLLGFALAARDDVERLFHRRGEAVVDEVAEVPLEQVRDRERGPRGHERGALAPHVAARLDRLDHRRVRRRAADAALLELLHEARLGVARGRLGLVRRPARARCTRPPSPSATDGRRASRFDLVALVDVFDVGAPPAEEVVRLARRRGTSPARRAVDVAREPDRHLAAARVDHLARDRADPDQLVEPLLVGVELGAHLVGRADAGRPRAGSPRAPPARSSPCCGTRAARRAGSRRRTARGSRLRAAVIACSDRFVLSVRMYVM